MSRTPAARTAGTALAVAAVIAATACANNHPAAAAPPPGPVASVTPVAAVPSPAPQSSAPTTPPSAAPPTAPGIYAEYLHDNGNLLYVMTPGAHTWKLLGSVPDPVFDDATQVIYPRARDTHRVLVDDNADNSLWNQAVDGSDRKLVVRPPKGYNVCNAEFDALGDRIQYGLSKGGKDVVVYTARPDGTDRRRVPGATTFNTCFNAWSADGSTMLFINTYVKGLPIREYHEVHVYDGIRTREVTLKVTDKVHVDSALAVSADGRYALVGAMRVNSQGECGDGDDRWFIADLRTGATAELKAATGTSLRTGPGIVQFDASDRLLVVVGTYTVVKTDIVTSYAVGVFDTHARRVATLPNPSRTATDDFALWTVVA